MKDPNKFSRHYHSLVGLIKVFDDTTPKAENIALSLVREYERFMDETNRDLPDTLSPFNKDDYFSWSEEGKSWYESAGIKAHMQRNLGILKTIVDDFSQTPVTEEKSFHFLCLCRLNFFCWVYDLVEVSSASLGTLICRNSDK